jgi:hypothetical protein
MVGVVHVPLKENENLFESYVRQFFSPNHSRNLGEKKQKRIYVRDKGHKPSGPKRDTMEPPASSQ